jgi:hypothetical protein
MRASVADTMPLENERMAVNSSAAMILCMKNSRAPVTPAASRGGLCVVCRVHVCSYACQARWNADLLMAKDPNQEQGDEHCCNESAKSVRLHKSLHDQRHNVCRCVSLSIALEARELLIPTGWLVMPGSFGRAHVSLLDVGEKLWGRRR